MNLNKISDFIKSKKATALILIFLSLALLSAAFNIGVQVGFRKARFSYAWGENYHRNFGGPKEGFLRDLDRDWHGMDFIDADGISGKIIKIVSPSSPGQAIIIVKGRDNTERSVVISDKTAIERWHESVRSEELKINDIITIIGDPNDQGQIEAKFIRLFK